MVAIVGKRGSGKSYSLGTLIEPLAISDATLTVANTNRSRAALLFDTLGIFQWMDVPVTESGESTEIRNQYRARSGWDLPEASIDVAVWRPRGSGRLSDHHMELAVRCSDLDSSDWCYLLGLDPIQDRMGQLLSDAFQKVTSEGWRSEQGFKQPKLQYGLDDIVSCIQSDDELISAYQSETKRALTQQLKTFSRNPIFSDDGIGLKDLLIPNPPRGACERPPEEAKGCTSESEIMVLQHKTCHRKGAPNRCYHVTTLTASKSPSTIPAW